MRLLDYGDPSKERAKTLLAEIRSLQASGNYTAATPGAPRLRLRLCTVCHVSLLFKVSYQR